MKWFKHDSDAAQDAKIRKLIIKYGPTGYAMYFYCLELIAGNVTDANITFELEHDAEIIADGLKVPGTAERASVDVVNDIMRYMVSLGLFELSGERITCFKMARRLDQSMTNSKKMRSIISGIRDNSADVMTCHDMSQDVMLEKKRIEQNRQEENRTEESKSARANTKHEKTGAPINKTRYENLCDEYGSSTVDDYIQRAVDYVDAKGIKPYADYTAAASNWLKRDGVKSRSDLRSQIGRW